MMKLLVTLSLLLALAAPAGMGQTNRAVVPRDCALVDGDGSHLYPFSYAVIRDQVLVRSAAVAPNGGSISALAFRADGISTATFAARTYALRVDICQTSRMPAAMSPNFATNRGSSPVTTVFNGNLKLPPMAPATKLPAPFTTVVSFTKAYPFSTKAGNLIFEFVGLSSSPTTSSYRVDGISRNRVSQALVARIGHECQGKGGEKATLFVYKGSWVPGGVAHVSWQGTGGLNSMVSWLGTRSQGKSPYPIPLDLAGLGAPGCSLYCDIVLLAVQPAKGTFVWGPLPNLSSLTGMTIYTQGAVAAPGANALGLVMSQGEGITIGSTSPISDMHSNYSRNSITNPTGWCFTSNFYGPVIEVRGTFN